MPIQNSTVSHATPPSLAAPPATTVENAITPELHQATNAALKRAIRWEIAEGCVTVAALLASISMAGVQLANRTDGLQTSAEKLAAATVALNAGDILLTLVANTCGLGFRTSGRNGVAIAVDTIKMSALGLGLAGCSLVLQDPQTHSAGKAHEGAAIGTMGLIGGAFLMNAAKWVYTPKFKKVNNDEEIQLADIRTIQ